MGCTPTKTQLRTVEVSQRVPHTYSVQFQERLAKCTCHAVSSQELRFLTKLYNDLASRSSGETIDRHTFLRFFPLPVHLTQGIWGERLFENFDQKKLGLIDYEEFITGLSVCAKGSEEEKLRFLFSLYDLKGDGFIDKAELKIMVRFTQIHNTFKQTMRSSGLSEGTVDFPEEQRDFATPISPKESLIFPRRGERRSSAALIKRDDAASPDKVETLAGKIMKDLTATDRLDFEQFKKYIEQNPRVMEVFSNTFHEDLWSGRFRSLLPESTEEESHIGYRRCISCFGNAPPVAKVLTHSTTSFLQEKSGWLYRKTRDSEDANKVYVVMRCNMLLVYSSPSAPMPNSVIFLGGCFIDPLAEFSQSQKHGFSISHQFENFKQVSFWCTQKEERDDWVQRLGQVAKTSKVDDFYEFKDRLGTGKFSDVFRAIELQTDFEWAIKVVEKTRLTELEREMLRSEIAIMRLLNHQNVVQMKEVFEDRMKMYMVMELVEGGELFDRIRVKKVFSEFTAFHVTRQLLETVKYLHEVGIVHRDIKPENILLSDDSEVPVIKLADFGLSKLVGPNDSLTVPCGTLGYVAPEVLMQRPYGKPVDLWSIGVVTYLMLRGRLPFDSKDKQILIEKTIEARIDLVGPYWSKYTEFAIDFLRKILTKDPDLRLTCADALAHSWISKGDILIPRKINKHMVEENLMKKTITNAKMQNSIYSELPKSVAMDPVTMLEQRLIYTTPDLFEDMHVERKDAEQSLAVRLRDD